MPQFISAYLRIVAAAGGAFACVIATGQASARGVPDHAASLTWRARAADLAYNLDYDEAAASYEQAAALDPDDPAVHRLLASAVWMKLLFDRGAILVDDYLGQARDDFKRDPPPPDSDRRFHAEIDKSLALAEARLKTHPTDADAHYQNGATLGFLASYTATVEGRLFGSVRVARRAVGEHEHVLVLAPTRVEAGFIVGTYRYAVSQLSLPTRVLARLAGLGADHDRGLALIEAAANTPNDVQSDAQFALVLIYNREKRFDDAQRSVALLRERYPRNRLLLLESASTALRAGRPAEARQALEAGMRMLAADSRPRAYGEEARWKLTYGRALVLLHDLAPAERELRGSIALVAPDWVHGRANLELGKIADLNGNRPRAVETYRRAAALCVAGNDDDCAGDARRFTQSAFRGASR